MEKSLQPTNIARVEGEISQINIKRREGILYYSCTLNSPRYSGTVDTIQVEIPKRLVERKGITLREGVVLNLKGEFRSRNERENGISHLILFFFAKDILPTDGYYNKVYLQGFICKQPVYRETPFKKQICEILLAVNRPLSHESDYIPCILWGTNAITVRDLPIGTKISGEGRIQSRKYSKQYENGEISTKIAYEVSLNSMKVEALPVPADDKAEA